MTPKQMKISFCNRSPVVIDGQQWVNGVLPAFPKQAHTLGTKVERERAWVGQDSLLFQFGADLGDPEIAEVGRAVGAGEQCAYIECRRAHNCVSGMCQKEASDKWCVQKARSLARRGF